MMDWLTVAVIVAAIAAGAWLLWRARCRGHDYARRLRDYDEQSRRLMREEQEEERWRKTFDAWQVPASGAEHDDSQQAPHPAGK
jgi:hypothetical protein